MPWSDCKPRGRLRAGDGEGISRTDFRVRREPFRPRLSLLYHIRERKGGKGFPAHAPENLTAFLSRGGKGAF